MDPEVKKELQEIHALVRDNHHLLRAVRRHQIITDYGKFFIYLILAGSAAYYYFAYLQPYVQQFQAKQGTSTSSGPFGLPSSAEIQKLINSYQNQK